METSIFTEEQEAMLHAPLDATHIRTRPGGRGLLKYIKGDTAIDAANRIFGFGRWGYKVIARSHEVIEDEKKGRIEFYTADIELFVVGAAFPFPGDGVGIVTAPFTVEMHEKARKEAATDALKRALRHYGDQFGLSLYDEDDYVELNGEMVQVKAINPQQLKQQQQPRRIVEASQRPQIAQQKTVVVDAQPATTSNHQDQKTAVTPSEVDKVKARFVEVWQVAEQDIETRWKNFKRHVLQEAVADPNLSAVHLGKLNGYIVAEEKKLSKAS